MFRRMVFDMRIYTVSSNPTLAALLNVCVYNLAKIDYIAKRAILRKNKKLTKLLYSEQ